MFVEQKSLSMAKNCFRIHNAAYFADLDLLRTLLTTDKTYANSRNEKGNTPLASTLIGKSNTKTKLFVLEILIQNGAEINYVNDEEDSILHIAVRTAFHQKVSTKVVKWLINHGADKTLVNKQNLTASQLAFHVSNSKLGTFLLFYDSPPGPPFEERPSYSATKGFSSNHNNNNNDNNNNNNNNIKNNNNNNKNKNGSHLSYRQTFSQQSRVTKSPGMVRSLIDHLYPLCVSKYPQDDMLNATNKPFPINRKSGKTGDRKRARRYYEDIDISSDEGLASTDELFRTGYENIFEQLHLNRNEEGNFILQLNDSNNSSSDVSRAVVIAASSDESFDVNDNDQNCSDT